MRESILGALDYLAASDPEHADIIKVAIDIITEDGRKIKELEQKNRVQTILDFADKLKRYYNTLKGNTNAGLVAYHIDQIVNDTLRREGLIDDES